MPTLSPDTYPLHTLDHRRTTLGGLYRDDAAPPDALRALPVVAVRTALDPCDAAHARALASWLTPAELETPRPWRARVRREHWCAGRVASKAAQALAAPQLAPPSPYDWTLAPGHHGAPELVASRPNADPLPIALTHSGDWAIACAIPPGWWLGIDFEIGADDRIHLSKRVCSPADRTRHGLNPDAGTQAHHRRFGTLWTLKEAVLKAWRVGLVDDLQAIEVTALSPHGRAAVQLARPVHPELPPTLPDATWAATALFDDAPLSTVACPIA